MVHLWKFKSMLNLRNAILGRVRIVVYSKGCSDREDLYGMCRHGQLLRTCGTVVSTDQHQDERDGLQHSSKLKDVIPPKLPEVTPEAKNNAAEAKARADAAYRRKDYMTAIDAYTQAIDFDPSDATLLSNRSLSWIRLGQAEHALADAKACRALRPDWPKACYREGAALRLMQWLLYSPWHTNSSQLLASARRCISQ